MSIENLIAEKCKLRRKWHESRNLHDKNLLNRVSQQLSKEIRYIEQSSIAKFLAELTPDSSTEYSLWKATNYLKQPIAQLPPKTDGRWACNNYVCTTLCKTIPSKSCSRHITSY
jgi:hypothetical protein